MAQTQTPKMNVNDVAVKQSSDQSFLWANPRSKACCASIISRKRYLIERSVFNSEFFNNFPIFKLAKFLLLTLVFSAGWSVARCCTFRSPNWWGESTQAWNRTTLRTHFGKKNTSVLCSNFTQFCKQYSRKIGNCEEIEWMTWWVEATLLLIQSSQQNELAKVDFGKKIVAAVRPPWADGCVPAAANIHKLNACGLLIIKRLLIIDEEGMIKVMLIRVMIIVTTMKIKKVIKQAFHKAEPFCYQCTWYQRMNINLQEIRRTCVSECIYAPTIYVYSRGHVLDRD